MLGVSLSGYYAWRDREMSPRRQYDAVLKACIRNIHHRSRGTYGAPRIHAELAADGIRIGRKRVARLTREMDLAGVSRCKGTRTTRPDHRLRPTPDLAERRFEADAPDRLWVADLGRLPVSGGGRRRLQPAGGRLVNGQSPAHLTGARGAQHGAVVAPSMGSVGDCFDNAMAESFFATLECELIDRRVFRTQAEARMAIFEYIEGWYNPHRRHSSLGYFSPLNFERNNQQAA